MDKRMCIGLKTAGVMASAACILAMLLASGCGGGVESTDLAQVGNMPAPAEIVQQVSESSNVAIDLPAAMREIAALEAPADVDAEVFAELKDELTRLLGERISGRELAEEPQERPAMIRSESAIRKSKYVPEPFQPRIHHDRHTLSWHYILEGDYDQNGVVTAADLVPLAGHLREFAGSGGLGDYFDIGTIDYVIDRNGDGFITPADLTAIAVNYGRQAGAYKAYASESWWDRPWAPDKETELSSPGVPPFSTVGLSQARLSSAGQLYFEIPLSSGDYSYNWITREDQNAIQRSHIALRGETFGEIEFGVTPFRERETALLYYEESNSIGMLPILQGDGDGTGQVTIADITPLGILLGKSVDIPLPIRAYHRADYNLDGIISLYDLQPIGSRLTATLDGYNLYYAENSGQLPEGYWSDE
ncbi:hypothetical protein KDL29_07115 [bacterium]|nr:hypothetical protein [bacterium]